MMNIRVNMKGKWVVGLMAAIASSTFAHVSVRETAEVPVEPAAGPGLAIDSDYLHTVDFLLAHGFADPRGGVLSRATVLFAGRMQPVLKPTEVVGWLMPVQPDKPRQIVLANGLSYDVVSVRGPVSAKELELPAGASLWQPINGESTGGPAAAFLIRGETRLAEAYFNRFPRHWTVMRGDREDYFEELAGQYLKARLLRALQARAAGNDRLALSDAENLKANREAYERERLRLTPGASGFDSLRVLNNIDYLVEDSKLRIRAGGGTKVDLKQVLSLPPKARIAALLSMLDEVAGSGWFSYRAPYPADDPIFKAIVSQGRDAVEPLLHAMEVDHRWTRSFSIQPGFGEELKLVSDREMAYDAFANITQFEARNSRSTPDVKTLRAYWQANKDLTPAGRWFKVLADDQAGGERWLSAARDLIYPSVLVQNPSPQSKEFQTKKQFEESVRARKNPSVSELLAQRVHDLLTIPLKKNEGPQNKLVLAMEMAHEFYNWDRRASLALLQQVTQAVAAYRDNRFGGSLLEFVGGPFAALIEDRLDLHDDKALDDYALALESISPGMGFRDAALFEPLVTHMKASQLDGVANRMFAGPGTKWNVVNLIKADIGGFRTRRLVTSPLLELQPWRDQVLAAMQDTTPLGQVEVGTWGMKFFQGEGQGATSVTTGIDLNDPKLPPPDKKIDYRVCDMVASMISELAGAPAFRIYWPAADRDKAIAAETEFMNQNSSHISKLLAPFNDWRMFMSRRAPSKAAS